jgi:hypothetical protein
MFESLLLSDGANILLLILCQDQVITPSIFATSFDTMVRSTVDRLGNAVFVSALVPLHILLEVKPEFSALICTAGDSGQSCTTTARAELF